MHDADTLLLAEFFLLSLHCKWLAHCKKMPLLFLNCMQLTLLGVLLLLCFYITFGFTTRKKLFCYIWIACDSCLAKFCICCFFHFMLLAYCTSGLPSSLYCILSYITKFPFFFLLYCTLPASRRILLLLFLHCLSITFHVNLFPAVFALNASYMVQKNLYKFISYNP